LGGNRIFKPLKSNELDELLNRFDDNESGRSIYDPTEGKQVPLTEEEIRTIQRIQNAYYPDPGFDAYPEYVDYYTKDREIMPVTSAPEPKRRFVPSKWERDKVLRLVRAIRRGYLKFTEAPKKPRWYNLWDVSSRESEMVGRLDSHIAAPKVKLPGHAESYNPPEEYLPTPEEIKKWEQMDPEDRPVNFIPQKYANLRGVPAYKKFFHERFERCLDLYLCPRVKKAKMQVDPESLLPKLPKPRDLQPFPTFEALVYRGHLDMVRSISIDPTGQWFVSGSDDKTVRLWELSTGRCVRSWNFDEKVHMVSWNPNPSIHLFATVSNSTVTLIDPRMGSEAIRNSTETLIATGSKRLIEHSANALTLWQYSKSDHDDPINEGFRVSLRHQRPIGHLTWHRKGDYFATVCSEGEPMILDYPNLSFSFD
jgi:ribosome biogenesis protein ERB1